MTQNLKFTSTSMGQMVKIQVDPLGRFSIRFRRTVRRTTNDWKPYKFWISWHFCRELFCDSRYIGSGFNRPRKRNEFARTVDDPQSTELWNNTFFLRKIFSANFWDAIIKHRLYLNLENLIHKWNVVFKSPPVRPIVRGTLFEGRTMNWWKLAIVKWKIFFMRKIYSE